MSGENSSVPGNNSIYPGVTGEGNMPLKHQLDNVTGNGQSEPGRFISAPLPPPMLAMSPPGYGLLTSQTPLSMPTSSFIQDQHTVRPPPFSRVTDNCYSPGVEAPGLIDQLIPSPTQYQSNSREENIHARPVGQLHSIHKMQSQLSEYHQNTIRAGETIPAVSEMKYWSQQLSETGERMEARVQIPRPISSPEDQNTVWATRETSSGQQRAPLISLAKNVQVQHSDPYLRPPGDYITHSEQQLGSTGFHPGVSEFHHSPEVHYGLQQNAVRGAHSGLKMSSIPPAHPQMGSTLAQYHYEPYQQMSHYSTALPAMHPTLLSNMQHLQQMYTPTAVNQPPVRDVPEALVDEADDISESLTGSKKKTKPQPQPQPRTIKIRGVKDKKMATKCKYFFLNPNNGGGEIQELKWDNTEQVFYITFTEAEVAKRVASAVHLMDNCQLEISLIHGDIPKTRTVEISGGDVEQMDIYKLYFENPRNGGGAIHKVWAEKQQVFIMFEDSAVVETVCSQKHEVEELLLEVKPTNRAPMIEFKGEHEQAKESCSNVEATTGQQIKGEKRFGQFLQSHGNDGLKDRKDLIFHKEDGEEVVTFHNVKDTDKHCRPQTESKDSQVDVAKTTEFYPRKLLFRNVDQSVTQELLINYMENISGQDDIQAVYSDEPGDVLVSFPRTTDFQKIEEKCRAKLLSGRKLEVHRVPVSNCIMVENLSPNTSDDDVAYYIENQKGCIGTVLQVRRWKDQSKYVFFRDPEVADRVAMMKNLFLHGRELRVKVHLECLGPSGGKDDPYVFEVPRPLELHVDSNIKVCFLRHCTAMLQTFNESLSKVHALARIVEDALIVECTLNELVPKVHLIVGTWRDNVNKQLEMCFELIRLDEQNVLPEIWPEVMKAAEKCKICGNDLLLPLVDKHTFVILGRKTTEGETFERIQSLVEEAEKEVALKKREVTETKDLKKHEVDLLIMSSFPSVTEGQYNRLSVKIAEQEGKITFHGQLTDIREAEIKMRDLIHSVSSMVVTSLTDSKITLLSSANCRDLIGQNLKSSGVSATWVCHDEGVVSVYCLKESDLKRAVQVIQASLKEETLYLDDVSSSTTRLTDWASFKESLIHKNKGSLIITTRNRNILITSVSDIMPDVRKEVKDFILENSIYTAVFSFSPSRQKFLTDFWKDKLRLAATKLSMAECIILNDQERNITVKGRSQDIERARKALENLEKEIECTEEKITKKETIAYLAGLKSINELSVTAKGCECVLSLSYEKNSFQIVSTNQPAKRPKVTVDHRSVTAMLADITTLKVDVIVNAANSSMDHGGGLAKAIVLKGGKEIQIECHCLVQDSGELSEGDVLVSGPGKLPCKSIIHAVGPMYQGGTRGEKECLRSTVMKCLKTASDLFYASIAIPAISSGIFRYPVEEATRAIVKAVSGFFDNHPESSIRDVILCDVLSETVDLFQRALEQTSFGNPTTISPDSQFLADDPTIRGKLSKSPEAQRGIKTFTAEREKQNAFGVMDLSQITSSEKTTEIVTDAAGSLQETFREAFHFKAEDPKNCSWTPPRAVFCKPETISEAERSFVSFDVSGLHLTIKKGDITEEDVDAIVNSSNTDLDLSKGAVSQVLRAKCGKDLESECRSKLRPCESTSSEMQHDVQPMDNQITDEEVKEAISYLKSGKAAGPDGIVNEMFKAASRFITPFLAKLLNSMTSEHGLRNRLNLLLSQYSKMVTTKWEKSYEAVLREAEKKGLRSLAVPALGTGTFGLSPLASAHALAKALSTHTQTMTTLRRVTVVVINESTVKNFTDVLRIGVCDSHTNETSVSIDLRGLHLTIKQGDITEEVADAIINSSSEVMDLNQGAVSKILKVKCGEDLQNELLKKRADMRRDKMVMTAAYNLKCRNILHIDAAYYNEIKKWKKAYKAVLQEADRRGLISLAVPALGTGSYDLSPLDSARALAQALKTHTQTKTTLRRVTVVLINQSTMRAFADILSVVDAQATAQPQNIPEGVPKKSTMQKILGVIGWPSKPKTNTTQNVFKLYIFSGSKGKREEFLKELDALVNAKYEIKVVKDLEKISSEEFMQMEEACKGLNVEIQEGPTGPTLKGMPEDVEKARNIIGTLLKVKDREREETMMARLVQWYYFEMSKTGKNRKSFGKRENLMIEEAFQHYQTDKNSDSAQVTEENGHFLFINFTDNMMYSQQFPSDSIRVFRKEIIKGGVSTASLLPDSWDIQEDEVVKVVALYSGCEEYSRVYSNFLNTAQELPSILSIERIQNPELHTQYEAKKVQMYKQNKGMQSEKTLWHGTSSDIIPNINRDGFNRSFCGKNATRFGLGAYFAVNSAYSMRNIYSPADSVGKRYMYQCKVLVGHTTQGDPSMKTLPIREGKIRYDSATNDTQNPEMYVIFHDSQAYPEYLITFK